MAQSVIVQCGRRACLTVAAIAMAVLPLGCFENGDNPKKRKIGTRPLPLVDVKTLEFENAKLKERFAALDAAASDLAKADFEHWSYGGKGNNVFAEWAKGVALGEGNCRLRGPIDSLKLFHRIHVGAKRVPETAPVNSLRLRVELVAPRPEEWCVDLFYQEGLPVTYVGWSLKIFRWDPAKYYGAFVPEENFKERIDLPISRYEVCASSVELRSDLSLSDSFVRYVKSADALRDTCVDDLAQLEKEVVALIKAHKAEKKIYGEPDGSIPPPFHLERLNPHEEQAQLAMVRHSFAAKEELIRAHHKEMYETLQKSFPLDRGWPELAEKK